jgi:hypothetical protein
MKRAIHLEYRASSSWSEHEGESSLGLCDRLDRTRDNSQRQLPTDHDYAVPTREYQTDQSSLKPAHAAARSVLGKKQKQRQLQKQPHRSRGVDTVTPYQANSLIEHSLGPSLLISPHKRISRHPISDLPSLSQKLRIQTDPLPGYLSAQPLPAITLPRRIIQTPFL